MSERAAYHHGDLRRTLLAAAVELIAEQGIASVSLRELARRSGVSHAAPTHHFADKAGLFTAIAIEGHRMLADSFTVETRTECGRDADRAVGTAGKPDAQQDRDHLILLRELGVRYVRFALDHSAHFDVMFRPDLYRADDPVLLEARARTAALLHDAVPGGLQGPRTRSYGLAAWSAAHGFATLWRDGSLAPVVGSDDPEKYFREAAGTMFGQTPADPSTG